MSSYNQKAIAVFDLDRTLIKGDSLSELVFRHLVTNRRVLGAALRRKLLGGDRSEFAEHVHEAMLFAFSCPAGLKAIIDRLALKVCNDRLSVVQNWKRRGVTVILLSASPQDYVAPLAIRFGMDHGFGSFWYKRNYNHLFGARKAEFLRTKFPKEEWEWLYAMSDAISDEPLLAEFRHGELVKPL